MSKLRKSKIQLVLLTGLCLLSVISAFNISPKPNLVFKEPELRVFQSKTRSSYFGFTVNLRGQSIIVGAPRAQSSLESQRVVNESGAIYKCNIPSGQCTPFVFDPYGNIHIERRSDIYDSERKDFQWMGSSMDGGSNETDRLVVCASRLISEADTEYLGHGVCYWTPDTSGMTPKHIQKIAPVRSRSEQMQMVNGKRVYYYTFSQMGISVHVTGNNEEILIGAPGISNWRGSVIRYRPREEEDFGGLSRRNLPSDGSRGISASQFFDYTSDIPDPSKWGQKDDSYFGYAVTSGYFNNLEPHKIYYVASAPQAGEVYLFSFISKTISIHRTFSGQQYGEYFGYSVLSEDFNGDGQVDLAVSAPLFALSGSYENGAVYVFLNRGEMNFELSSVLKSGNYNPGRFGVTLSKLGDIDNDGYNDIAIGAPFEDNGAVYIFLGASNGFHEKPSQVIQYPNKSGYQQSMFGHGISKGVDIDLNGHNDLAIGAPNSDTIFLYRTYPVVHINAYTQSLSRSISINETKFRFRACWKLESTSERTNRQSIRITLKVDPHVKRVFFAENVNEIEFEALAENLPTCKLYDVMVKFSLPDIFKPIDIEIHYGLINTIPDSENFCETCAAINPHEPKFSTEKITFSTGCKTDICLADLQVSGSGFGESYVLGSSRTQVLTYTIRNSGETSYLTELNITSSSQMPFARIPSSCTLQDNSLRCTLFKGRPMPQGVEDTLAITFDTSNLAGDSVTVRAEAISTGNELNPDDNVMLQVIRLREFSEIDISYQEITPRLSLESEHGIKEIKNQIEIRNNGPSKIKNMKVRILIPISYLVPKTQRRIQIVEYNNITITAEHNNRSINAVFTQNNTIIIQNAIESSSTEPSRTRIVANLQGMGFDSSNVGYPIEYDPGTQQDTFDSNTLNDFTRRKRSIGDFGKISAPAYDQLIQWHHTKTELRDSLSNLLNRSILLNCLNPSEALCIEASLEISNLLPGDNIVSIGLSYQADLDQIDKILTESKDIFVITTLVDVIKIDDEQGTTIKVRKSYPHNIISKYKLATIQLWVIIISIIAGLLIFVLITYAFYRMGFFRREKKEQLEKLHRRSQQSDEESEQRLT